MMKYAFSMNLKMRKTFERFKNLYIEKFGKIYSEILKLNLRKKTKKQHKGILLAK